MPGPAPASHALVPANRASLIHAQFAEDVYGWTECVDNSTNVDAFDFSYMSSLWSNELEWMRLPPSTHLLLFGRSSMAQVSSALRAGNRALGELMNIENNFPLLTLNDKKNLDLDMVPLNILTRD